MVTEFSEWRSITACTTDGASMTEIDCNGDVIQIGHSHYGVKAKLNYYRSGGGGSAGMGKFRCGPNFEDCVMDYTSKLGDRCNGLSKCSMSLLKQLIHKCAAPATYIYFTYRCVKIPIRSNVCKPTEYRTKEAHLISPLFPYDYPKNVDCTCIVNRPDKTVLMTEDVSYQVLSPDTVTIQTESTKPAPLYANNASTIIRSDGSTVIRFQSDSSLSKSGFWLKLAAYPTCSHDWEPIDDKCVRIVKHRLPWDFARQSCRKVGGHLLTMRDHVRRSRMQSLLSASAVNESVWIGLRRQVNSLRWDDGLDDDWKAETLWPWDRSNAPSPQRECTMMRDHRWDMADCNTPMYFVCEQDLSRIRQEMLLTCGKSSNLVKASAYAMRARLTGGDKFSQSLDWQEQGGFGNAASNGDPSAIKRAVNDPNLHLTPALKSSSSLDTIRLCLILTFLILVMITLIACNVMLVYLCQRRLKKNRPELDGLYRSGSLNSLSDTSYWFWRCLLRASSRKTRTAPLGDAGLQHAGHRRTPAFYLALGKHDRWSCCRCSRATQFASQSTVPSYMDPLISRGSGHLYESLLMHRNNKATDSGYSTVPNKTHPLCFGLGSRKASLASRQLPRRYGPCYCCYPEVGCPHHNAAVENSPNCAVLLDQASPADDIAFGTALSDHDRDSPNADRKC